MKTFPPCPKCKETYWLSLWESSQRPAEIYCGQCKNVYPVKEPKKPKVQKP